MAFGFFYFFIDMLRQISYIIIIQLYNTSIAGE